MLKNLINNEEGIKIANNFKALIMSGGPASEKLLDKIAKGKIQWFNVLREYYDDFNPIVEKLSLGQGADPSLDKQEV